MPLVWQVVPHYLNFGFSGQHLMGRSSLPSINAERVFETELVEIVDPYDWGPPFWISRSFCTATPTRNKLVLPETVRLSLRRPSYERSDYRECEGRLRNLFLFIIFSSCIHPPPTHTNTHPALHILPPPNASSPCYACPGELKHHIVFSHLNVWKHCN